MKNSILLIRRKGSFFIRLFVPLFFLFNLSLCIAQYHPFPIEDGIWINKERNYYLDQNYQQIYTSNMDTKYCANGNDTVINSITYKQIDYCYSTSSYFHGAMRYDVGQVYFVPRDSLNEFLLYDFTLNSGDAVTVLHQSNFGYFGYMPPFHMTPTYINYVDTVIVNGTSRRRLMTDGYEWIEGIGSTSGLFMEPWINVSNYTRELICMSKEDTIHYLSGILEIGEIGACDFTVSTETFVQNPLTIQAFPNPTSRKVIIKMSEDVQWVKVVLTNILGQKLANYNFDETDFFEIEIEGEAGIYFIEIYTSKSEKSVLKILKQ